MPFINTTSSLETKQRYDVYDHRVAAPFSEVFGASLGRVIDEELSISIMLNREGFNNRKREVERMADAGEIDLGKYRIRKGRNTVIDYNRIAEELEVDSVKTDQQLNEERNRLLADRRAYGEDVIERGSGLAQFAGAMTGYMLDPISIATIGISAPATVAKATTLIGKAALASRNAALIEGAAELGIQTFVHSHKQDIDAPHGAADALANIATAATGAAAAPKTTNVRGALVRAWQRPASRVERAPA